MCTTLFHESALRSVIIGQEHCRRIGEKNCREGMDMYISQDPEVQAMVALGKYTRPLFPENGLLKMKINFNMDAARKPNQTTNLADPVGGKIMIHSNRRIPKMSTEGFFLIPGKK